MSFLRPSNYSTFFIWKWWYIIIQKVHWTHWYSLFQEQSQNSQHPAVPCEVPFCPQSVSFLTSCTTCVRILNNIVASRQCLNLRSVETRGLCSLVDLLLSRSIEVCHVSENGCHSLLGDWTVLCPFYCRDVWVECWFELLSRCAGSRDSAGRRSRGGRCSSSWLLGAAPLSEVTPPTLYEGLLLHPW